MLINNPANPSGNAFSKSNSRGLLSIAENILYQLYKLKTKIKVKKENSGELGQWQAHPKGKQS